MPFQLENGSFDRSTLLRGSYEITESHSLFCHRDLSRGCFCREAFAADRVKIANGVIEATVQPGSGVRSFKGIPFAQPPVGDLRWREPQPVKNWKGVRSADQFGPRCMQRTSPTRDYWFRSNGMSEDCLYLNVWTPAKSDRERLPVLVYIFGGGFQNGDGSEPRYDGESMARKGMVAVTVNYRTNIFGFFSHPELTKESPHHASGNYGLLDQVAALEWVQRNIAAFGGDPKRVTIAGESAGSISVSALMASPLSRDLIAGAIGESGALISTLPPRPLAETEQDGVQFAASAGAASLAALRAMTAEQIQEAMAKGPECASDRTWTATSCRSPWRRFSPPANRRRFRCWPDRIPRSRRRGPCSGRMSRRPRISRMRCGSSTATAPARS